MSLILYQQKLQQTQTMRYLTAIFCFLSFLGFSQIDLNLDLVSRVDAFEGSNDVWGFEHSNGTEYAILGTRSSTKIYSLANPTFPQEVAVFPGPVTTWRDIKNHNDYVYVTTDGDNFTSGLVIIDMTDPDNIESKVWSEPLFIGNTIDSLKACHNLYIDDGFAYLSGCNISAEGVIILDIETDPLNPNMVGFADQAYAHDVFVKGDRMYTSEIREGWFGVYDISNKANPVRIAVQETGTAFTHNAWTDEEENLIFTTDERPNAYLEAYDISDLSDIKLVSRYRPPETEFNGVIPHNTHYLDGFLITSWYTDGVVVVDANKPDNLIKVAAYDTWDGEDGGFNGCWGAFPYLPSGLLLASDRASGLYVFSPSYKRACYLEGTVTSLATGLPINGASITIESEQLAEASSNAGGSYKTGLADAGTYNVTVSHPDYSPQTVEAEMINGEITILDVQLFLEGASIYTGTVVKDLDGELIDNAQIKLIDSDGKTSDLRSDENGEVILELLDGIYTLHASKWGYNVGTFEFDTSTDPNIEIRLPEGFRDEFYFDFNWTFGGDVEQGAFEIAAPQELILLNNILNVGSDNPDDLGDRALITGNGTDVPIHLDYVNQGTAIATSPKMNLNSYDYPVIKMDAWYRHHGYAEHGPYIVEVKLLRGEEERIVMSFVQTDTTWVQRVFNPKDYFWDLTDVQVSFPVFNDMEGIFTELAIDVFEVVEGEPSSVQSIEQTDLLIYPNPMSDLVTVSLESLDFEKYILTDVNGKIVRSRQISELNFEINTASLLPGVYFLQLSSDEKISQAHRLIKQ